MDVQARVEGVFRAHPDVLHVNLVGSRASGTPTPLSDWDFQLETANGQRLAAELPDLVAKLDPLGALWDPLSDRATYCAVFPGAIKVDFFPGDETHEPSSPLDVVAENLRPIDAHFWDWLLWLGAKQLGGRDNLVQSELVSMNDFILHRLGVAESPPTLPRAVDGYLAARTRQEHALGVVVDPALGTAVIRALRQHGILD